MAKRSFSPVLWFLLALMLRAELHAAAPAHELAVANKKSKTATVPASKWKSPRQSTLNRAQPSRTADPTSQSVDYEISGETYASHSTVEDAPVRSRTSRRPANRRAAPQRAYEENEYEEVEYAEEQVEYEEGYPAEMDGAESEYPEEEYSDEMNEEAYWDEEAAHHAGHPTPRSRFFHWMESFSAEHGYWFRTSHNSPPNIGIGQPLKGTSWLNRPNSISFFAGVLNGDDLISNRVDQGSALFGGLRLGWDFDHYWGVEARGAWASPDIEFPDVPPDRVDGIFLCDTSILYYPWGDAACRPYTLLGMGMAMFDFTDEYGFVHDEFLLGIPIGLGFKYQYHPNLVFRAEFLDNIACGSSGLNTMNNLSFSLGMEMRFGGKPRSYYPWQPAKFIW